MRQAHCTCIRNDIESGYLVNFWNKSNFMFILISNRFISIENTRQILVNLQFTSLFYSQLISLVYSQFISLMYSEFVFLVYSQFIFLMYSCWVHLSGVLTVHLSDVLTVLHACVPTVNQFIVLTVHLNGDHSSDGCAVVRVRRLAQEGRVEVLAVESFDHQRVGDKTRSWRLEQVVQHVTIQAPQHSRDRVTWRMRNEFCWN